MFKKVNCLTECYLIGVGIPVVMFLRQLAGDKWHRLIGKSLL